MRAEATSYAEKTLQNHISAACEWSPAQAGLFFLARAWKS
jgi:hypothetical protein